MEGFNLFSSIDFFCFLIPCLRAVVKGFGRQGRCGNINSTLIKILIIAANQTSEAIV
jgi:hypothetical protein